AGPRGEHERGLAAGPNQRGPGHRLRHRWPRHRRPRQFGGSSQSRGPTGRRQEGLMKTVLYLLRHGATEANLAQPPRLQGRRHNPPLARLGVRQAEATRDFLAIRPIDCCYCSPLLRAMQTATIIAVPHGLAPEPLEALTECDVGRWEDLDWQTIRYLDAEAYQQFMANPAVHGYPGGESFAEVLERVAAAVEEILGR